MTIGTRPCRLMDMDIFFCMIRPDLTAGVKGLVSILSDQHGQHLGAVQNPPLQQEAGLRRGLHVSSQVPLRGVIRVAPRLHLAQEVHNLCIGTISVDRKTLSACIPEK